MLAPSRASSPFDVQLRFKVTDPDGLHQAQLYKPFGDYPSVIDFQELDGESDTVEFVTSELANGNDIVLRVMDVHGNFISRGFSIDINDLLPQPEKVQIPDPNLAALVRKTLGLAPEDAITQIDMLRLRELAYPFDSDSKITDLNGLEHGINLQSLRLNGNQIQDITPLTVLMKLSNLHIRGNPINDITPLAKLTNLQKLGLGKLQSSDITLFAGLTNLYSLWISESEISDITPLASLKNLRELYLVANSIKDITPIAGLTDLHVLNLNYNQISDIAPLTGLTNLYELRLAENRINDIKSLTTLTGLRILTMPYNQIRDVNPLVELTNLKELTLHNKPNSEQKTASCIAAKEPGYQNLFQEPP